jgi:transcriptional regulator with XRE-family HTH domain
VADIRERFGALLRQVRGENQLSQEKLAALAGLPRTFISMVERGKRNVTIATVEKLAAAPHGRPDARCREWQTKVTPVNRFHALGSTTVDIQLKDRFRRFTKYGFQG